MIDIQKHTIHEDKPLSSALEAMNNLEDLVLFIIDNENKLIGTLTDGDARRGLLNGFSISDRIGDFMNKSFFQIKSNLNNIFEIIEAKKRKFKVVPVVDDNGYIKKLINFSFFYSYLPIDVVIMAGGEGIRLRPLTENVPKPMLKVGGKPILEHVIDRLIRFGVNNFQISVNYLGNKIESYFNNGASKSVLINYIHENQKMGTIGSLTLGNEYQNDYLLVINSDILTNINYEDFFLDFIQKDADISIASVPYNVNIPYAIMDIKGSNIIGLKEKPTFNFITNAGIYLLKKDHLKRIPEGKIYNATDLIEEMIASNLNVTYFTIHDYWLDIGKMDDYNKAQQDIRHIKL
jgi:dTDP-glucose pyrophosphorylase